MLVRSARSNERGASAVEFALVLPVLVLLLVGIIQFGFLFFQWLEVTHAAREGARWASLRNPTGDVSTPGTTKYKVAEAAPGLSPTLTNDQITVDPDPPEDYVGDPVRVTVTYPTPIFGPLMEEIFGSGSTFMLSSSATQRIE